MTVGKLREIIRNLPSETEVQLLLPGSNGFPDHESAASVASVMVGYDYDGDVTALSIVLT